MINYNTEEGVKVTKVKKKSSQYVFQFKVDFARKTMNKIDLSEGF